MIEQEIDGVPHVTIPKELWDRMWDVFDRIEKMGYYMIFAIPTCMCYTFIVIHFECPPFDLFDAVGSRIFIISKGALFLLQR